jgi:hypothetical protein
MHITNLPSWTAQSGYPLTTGTDLDRDPHFKYLDDAMKGNDNAFINVRGINDAPIHATDKVLALLRVLCHERALDLSDVAYLHAKWQDSLTVYDDAAARLRALREAWPALAENTSKLLLDLRNEASAELARPAGQMAALLADAKLIFEQRGMQGDSKAIEAMAVLDAVLNRLVLAADMDAGQAHRGVLDVLTGPIKNRCETAIAEARDTYAFRQEYFKRARANKDEPPAQTYARVQEHLYPAVHAMAKTIVDVLGPYAQAGAPSSKAQTPPRAALDQLA